MTAELKSDAQRLLRLVQAGMGTCAESSWNAAATT
jgi:hypothetical protein